MQQPPRRAIESVGWTTAHRDTVTVFRVRRPLKQRWRWHVRAANGEVVEHGENYVRRIDAITAAERHHPPVLSPLAAEYRKRMADQPPFTALQRPEVPKQVFERYPDAD